LNLKFLKQRSSGLDHPEDSKLCSLEQLLQQVPAEVKTKIFEVKLSNETKYFQIKLNSIFYKEAFPKILI